MAKIISAELNFFICGDKNVGKHSLLRKFGNMRASKTELNDASTVIKNYILANLSYDVRFHVLNSEQPERQEEEEKQEDFKSTDKQLSKLLRNGENVFNFFIFVFDFSNPDSLGNTVKYVKHVENKFAEYFQVNFMVGNKLDAKGEEEIDVSEVKEYFIGNYFEVSTLSFFNFVDNFYSKVIKTCFRQILPEDYIVRTLDGFDHILGFKESFSKSHRPPLVEPNDNPAPNKYKIDVYSCSSIGKLEHRFNDKIFVNKVGPVFKHEKKEEAVVKRSSNETDLEKFKVKLQNSTEIVGGFTFGGAPNKLNLLKKRKIETDFRLEPIKKLFNSIENISNRKSPEKKQLTFSERLNIKKSYWEKEAEKRKSLQQHRRELHNKNLKTKSSTESVTTTSDQRAREVMYNKSVDYQRRAVQVKEVPKQPKTLTPGPGTYNIPSFVKNNRGLSFGEMKTKLPEITKTYPKYVLIESDITEMLERNKKKVVLKPTVPLAKVNFDEIKRERKIEKIGAFLSRNEIRALQGE